MKPFLTFLCCLLAAPLLRSQSTVSGQLLDEATGEPVGFANVALYLGDDMAAGATTDLDGKFALAGVRPGEYRLRATFIGYRTLERPLSVTAGADAPLGALRLAVSGATDLAEVTVTAERAVMELGLDRKSFNVDKSVAASGGSAEDLLRQIPSITLDLDGNVSLRGSGNVRFLVNGRPSGLVGADPSAFLKSLTAAQIERVEVITNPGAAFDPDGTAGLINIVLKRKRDDGFNATLNLNAGSNASFDGSLDLNLRRGKWNSFLGVSGRYDERFFRGFRDQSGTLADSTFGRFFRFDGNRLNSGQGLRGGTEYTLTKRATLGVQGNYQWQRGERDNLRTTDFLAGDGQPTLRSLRQETEPEKESEYELRLTYDQRFHREGRKLSAVAQYGAGNELETEAYDERRLGADGAPTDFRQRQRSPNREERSDLLLQVDYEQPVAEQYKFEAGYRSTIGRLTTDADFFDFNFGDDVFVENFAFGNLFEYAEDVHALYATFGGTLEKITFSAGLRAEQAYTTSELREPTRERFDNDYFKVYPSTFLGYALGDNTTLQASYSRRINRPRSWALNPFVDRGDPFNLRRGNPFLLPELINSYELNVQQRYGRGTLTAGLYFRQERDLITRVTRVLDREDPLSSGLEGVSLSTRENLNRGRNYGVEVISTFRPTEKLNLTLSANGYRSEIVGRSDTEAFDAAGYLFSGNAQGSYELPGGVQAQFTYFYRSPGVRPQGRIETIQSLDLGFRRDILEKRGTLTLRVTDLFNQRRYRFLTEVGGLVTNSEFQRQSRIVYLGFQYSLREVRGRGRGGSGRGGRPGGGSGGDDDF